MKILIVKSGWIGGWMDHVISALKKNGHGVTAIEYQRLKSPLRIIKLHNIVHIRNYLERSSWYVFNKKVKQVFDETKPDIFLTMNESYLLPNTIDYIRAKNCKTVCFVADNPFDSHRYCYFPISLQHFDVLLICDRIWIQNIRNVAANSKIIKIVSGGGFNSDIFYPVDESTITEVDQKEFSCDISFTGESYGMNAEGAYRAGILDQLNKYNVKIWGDIGWKIRFPHYENLARFYQGERLPYNDLRKLYKLSTINLNMPSPQILTGFQPRVFEIAACKGFQIVDWREEIEELFSEDELVTFKNINDLLGKADYFIKNPEKRMSYIEKAYKKVWSTYSFDKQINFILSIFIENNSDKIICDN